MDRVQIQEKILTKFDKEFFSLVHSRMVVNSHFLSNSCPGSFGFAENEENNTYDIITKDWIALNIRNINLPSDISTTMEINYSKKDYKKILHILENVKFNKFLHFVINSKTIIRMNKLRNLKINIIKILPRATGEVNISKFMLPKKFFLALMKSIHSVPSLVLNLCCLEEVDSKVRLRGNYELVQLTLSRCMNISKIDLAHDMPETISIFKFIKNSPFSKTLSMIMTDEIGTEDQIQTLRKEFSLTHICFNGKTRTPTATFYLF
ncbi:unnamed protein product [Moneuplotes crassus]|uniref:Uncharacterized protein n=1 Tax=Euplotes crassus TaxID=5936 RepID=A0AAD2D327_EUPCR|nr:unnamed protein product [Moneuplotes crassus]